ncbi:UNVERIFIED_CONTAM: hypothetical protein K2H54_068992 [Gekko kuhli]
MNIMMLFINEKGECAGHPVGFSSLGRKQGVVRSERLAPCELELVWSWSERSPWRSGGILCAWYALRMPCVRSCVLGVLNALIAIELTAAPMEFVYHLQRHWRWSVLGALRAMIIIDPAVAPTEPQQSLWTTPGADGHGEEDKGGEMSQ